LPVTGDLHEAEEVVQEAFARASVRWTRLRDYDVPEAWAHRVALNLAVALLEALRTLPMRQRQAIVLHPLVTADGTWPFVPPGPSGRLMASGRRG
jgi:predicted RNA polymerase sigma factor